MWSNPTQTFLMPSSLTCSQLVPLSLWWWWHFYRTSVLTLVRWGTRRARPGLQSTCTDGWLRIEPGRWGQQRRPRLRPRGLLQCQLMVPPYYQAKKGKPSHTAKSLPFRPTGKCRIITQCAGTEQCALKHSCSFTATDTTTDTMTRCLFMQVYQEEWWNWHHSIN